MALKKFIQYNNGADAEYHKIGRLTTINYSDIEFVSGSTDINVIVILRSYKDYNYRISSSIHPVFNTSINMKISKLEDCNREYIYTQLKSLDMFKDSEDV